MKRGSDKRALILSTYGFEESELVEPRTALTEAGIKVDLASPTLEPINGTNYDAETGISHESKNYITPDLTIDEVDASTYDVLILPGGVVNPDKLRRNKRAVEIVNEFVDSNKIVASICHGPWMLVEADVLRGKTTTGRYSIRTDLANAGATVVDEAVVIDANIITSRMPADLSEFSAAVIKAVGTGNN